MSDKTTELKKLTIFTALNFLISLFICAFFILFTGGHIAEIAFSAAALISNTAMLYAAIAIIALILWFNKYSRFVYFALIGIFQLALVTDICVFKIFKFHFNAMVWNIIVTPGGLESLDQGWDTKALFIFVFLICFAMQYLFYSVSKKHYSAVTAKRVKIIALIVLFSVFADKITFAVSNLYDYTLVTRNSRIFPLYQPLTVRKFMSKHFGFKLDNEMKVGIQKKNSGLDYPKQPLEIEIPKNKKNIILIAVDSLRSDMLTEEIMPNAYKLGQKGSIFQNHYSGGNCTRFGIFSIIYGIYGNYWFPMLGELRGPLLIDVMLEQGYDIRLFAASKLSFPEFNKTCFVKVDKTAIYDEPKGINAAAKDKDITEKLESYILSRDKNKPYFGFIFYDASHGSYDYEPEFEKFKPAEMINILLLNKGNIGKLFNKYKNSVHYDDYLIGKVIDAVKKTGDMENTVIVIAGDHGEAFMENDHYGHNQSYEKEEVKVPMVIYLPNKKGNISTRITSHLDLVPTLMEILGVKNNPSDYSSGVSLFSDEKRDFVPAASWSSAAIMRSDGYVLEMPLEAYKGTMKAFDSDYKETDVKSFVPQMLKFQKEAARFYKD